MRYFRLFLLNLEYVLSHKSRSIIWFLIALVGPFVFIVYWRGAFSTQQEIAGWTVSMITSYYIILSFVNITLMSHSEEDVGRQDIRDGNLTTCLLKPFSYYWMKFYEEIPYRIFQGACSLSMVLLLYILFGKDLSIFITPLSFIFIVIIFMLGFIISQTLKVIVGLFALWFIDIGGFFQIVEALIFILSGAVMPLAFMPEWLEILALYTPFPYIIYFPVVAIVEPLIIWDLIKIIAGQSLWIFILGFTYKIVWRSGIKKFTGVGN